MVAPELGYRDTSLPCSDGQGWENLCRALADKRSRQEEELDWSLPADAPLPYRYRWEHVKDVVENARLLAQRLGADEDACVAAAWLHDIRKLEDQHGRRGAAEAVQVLKATDFPQHKIGTVDTAIRLHEGFCRDGETSRWNPLRRRFYGTRTSSPSSVFRNWPTFWGRHGPCTFRRRSVWNWPSPIRSNSLPGPPKA